MSYDREEQIKKEFEERAVVLTKKYTLEMEKLRKIPGQIPEAQRRREGKRIVEAVETKMADLGERFREQMDKLTDEFIERLSEGGKQYVGA